MNKQAVHIMKNDSSKIMDRSTYTPVKDSKDD